MKQYPSLGSYNGQFVHGRLAVGGCPHPEHVPTFVAAGIKGIVDARSVGLREHVIYMASLPESIHWRLLGSWDGSYNYTDWHRDERAHAPTKICPLYAEFMIEQCAEVVRDHSPVLIHCGGGIGRSGKLAAVMFAALENCDVHEAIDRMRAYRPKIGAWGDHWDKSDPETLAAKARAIINTSSRDGTKTKRETNP